MKFREHLNESTPESRALSKQVKDMALRLTGVSRAVKEAGFPYDTPEGLKEMLKIEFTGLKYAMDKILRSIK